uniref:AB hydrolase-1 domain-containing protein n=1 Tax=Chenopodium quinoa TaxID=63459 RepID=A0A803LAW3_CHEQI
MTVKPLAMLSSTGYKMGVQYELKQGQNRQFHELSSGLKMEGESDAPADKAAGTLQTHAADVAHFIKKELTSSAVLVGHSFGDMSNQHPDLARAVLVCSVPPSGNSGLVWRYLFSKPIAAFKVTRSLAAKAFQTDLSLCKETFFSTQMDDNLVQRYQMLMKESSRLPLFDLRKLNASLPVPSVPESSVKVLVVGARDDFIVDAKGLDETGKFYGVSPVCVDGVAHDMMLDCSWEKGANVILSWLRTVDS